ncbi:MAG: tetratricopeptide repeat protein [Gemmatimonadota bacterium]|nr:MAG: tetratricopeptide repeat protein [Gemmatimonadota bacterium]
MPRTPARKQSRTPYWLRFSLFLVSFGGITSAFVLVVLPKRFVLQAGLVESGISFPAERPPFQPPHSRPIVRPAAYETVGSVPPGPAETLWYRVLPLLETGQYVAALTVMTDYLEDYPDDIGVWQEYARTLVKAGRTDEAINVYRRLAAISDELLGKLALARLLRDSGDLDDSFRLYRELIAAQPDDLEMHLEFARALVWAERYREARMVYQKARWLSPDDSRLAFELSQVLAWDNRPVAAYLLLQSLPSEDRESDELIGFRRYLDSLIVASLPPSLTPVDQARRAVALRDLERAEALYRRVLRSRPTDPDIWLEWAGFLQYHLDDPAAARTALLRVATMRDLTGDEQLRLARLHVWTGHENDAVIVLEGVVADDPTNADAWALLGDLHLWSGARLQARDAYESALQISPGHPIATAGLDTLRQQTYRTIAEQENPNAGPHLLYFSDSDEFLRLDLLAEAAFVRRSTAITVSAGYRRLEGVQLSGSSGSDNGPFAEVELAYWWRLGTIRTAVSAGVEQLDAFGNQPSFVAQFDFPDASGTAVRALYRHGPAFPQTLTYQSVQASLMSDLVEASAFRMIGTHWNMSISGSAGSFHADGSSNLRLGGAIGALYQFSPIVTGGLTTQLLAFADSAPRTDGQRLYWDPSLFWATGVQLTLSTPRAKPTMLYLRLTPGVALNNERDGQGAQWVPQLAAETGLRYETRRFLLTGDVAYLRGREGGYDSFGANFRFGVKY